MTWRGCRRAWRGPAAAAGAILLKVEARRAFELLPELILQAMLSPAIGIMIARGDLAVECGYERLAEVQEEILWICEAAHVPVVWRRRCWRRWRRRASRREPRSRTPRCPSGPSA